MEEEENVNLFKSIRDEAMRNHEEAKRNYRAHVRANALQRKKEMEAALGAWEINPTDGTFQNYSRSRDAYKAARRPADSLQYLEWHDEQPVNFPMSCLQDHLLDPYTAGDIY